jgi:hypothetical protein
MLLSAVLGQETRAGWSVGVTIGAPYCHHRCHPPFAVYRPYPIYVRPAPVFVQPVTVVEPVEVYQPVPVVRPVAPSTSRSVLPPPSPVESNEDVERYQRQMQSAEPRERAEAIMQLGRLRAPGAREALTAALNNDRSPLVRETAARALGLFGSPDSLDALQRAAQTDEDREVRRSASYAAEVIRANLSR